ncbi:MAG: hypothetical protein FJ246_01475 [Nitrospira sp.]|nr:hypothetical protein [Nitrospira sp.]
MDGTMKRFRRAGLWAVLLATAVTALPAVASAEENQVFFRGGFAQAATGRQNQLFTDTYNILGAGNNAGGTGWYIGAGLDQAMHKNFLGFKGMSLLGELGIEFKSFASNTVTSATALSPVNRNAPAKVQITMLTVDVSPKLKFREGEKLRPWVIPVGLDFHVISPPGNQAGYLDIGVQQGVGIEYNVWGPVNLGLDGRYHWAANMTNTVNNFGTVGAYVGILY